MSFAVLNTPWPYLAIAAFAAMIGWYVWRQPRRPGTRYFAWSVVVWLVWALAAALQLAVASPDCATGCGCCRFFVLYWKFLWN